MSEGLMIADLGKCSSNALEVSSYSKSVGHVTPDGKIICDMTEEELIVLCNPKDQVGIFAIIFLEILRLRKRVDMLESALPHGHGMG